MEKRGSHVGIFLSFIVFITFLVFLYSIIAPRLETQKEKEFILENLKKEVVDKTSSELIKATVTHDEDTLNLYNCLKVDNNAVGIEGLKAIVKDAGDSIIDSGFSSDSLIIDWTNNEKAFFKIYYSGLFTDSAKSAGSCDIPEISSIQTNKYVFESKIEEYITIGDFSDLNIPNRINFDIQFIDAGNGKTGKFDELKEVSTAIYADMLAVQYVDSQANIKTGFINIKVW